jgi:hypothetical protein
MNDLQRYKKDFIVPTIEDFEKDPTSVRLAFLACVAAFHGVDYLAWPDKPSTLRQKLRKNALFNTVDEVAHAFKHVATSRRQEKGLKASEVIFDANSFDGLSQDPNTGRVTLTRDRAVNLLITVKGAVDFLMAEGARLEFESMSGQSAPDTHESKSS